MTRVMLESFEVAIYFGLWAMLVVFGLWAYRRSKLRSMLWLEAYLLIYVPLSVGIDRLFDRIDVIRRIADKGTRPLGWSLGEFLTSWTAWRSLLDGLVLLVVAILIIADIIFLLRNAGTQVTRPPAQFSAWVRDRNAYVGLALLSIVALLPLSTGAFLLWLYQGR